MLVRSQTLNRSHVDGNGHEEHELSIKSELLKSLNSRINDQQFYKTISVFQQVE